MAHHYAKLIFVENLRRSLSEKLLNLSLSDSVLSSHSKDHCILFAGWFAESRSEYKEEIVRLRENIKFQTFLYLKNFRPAICISLIINYDTVILNFTKATWDLKKPLLVLKIVSLIDQLQSFTSWTVLVSVKNKSYFT